MKIADIGAGTGYFSIPVARFVGALGHVFAVDLQTEMLALHRQKLDRLDEPENVSLHHGKASKLPLQDGSVDLVFYANIWHELDDADSTFREAVRISVAGGKIAIQDWRDDCLPPPGPPQEHRIPENSVASFLNAKGCENVISKHVGQFGFLVTGELNSSKR
jgi:ubiquinone/menaquinone biosynthesis C-methylase UbiE